MFWGSSECLEEISCSYLGYVYLLSALLPHQKKKVRLTKVSQYVAVIPLSISPNHLHSIPMGKIFHLGLLAWWIRHVCANQYVRVSELWVGINDSFSLRWLQTDSPHTYGSVSMWSVKKFTDDCLSWLRYSGSYSIFSNTYLFHQWEMN